MSGSTIEWTELTWNPTTGCDRISPGCDHCSALTLSNRLKGMGSAKYQNDGDPRTSGPGFGLTIHPDTLDYPRTIRKGKRIFVNSMSDLFHAKVPLSFQRDVFQVMAETPQHTYQILTKRSLGAARRADRLEWPANVWMGVSVENAEQKIRIDHLRDIPAAVRFVSAEPLLEHLGQLDLRDIHQVITGGESGSGARPMHPDWARSIRDQCASSGVPFLFKQWGSWGSRNDSPAVPAKGVWLYPDGSTTTGLLSSPARSRQIGEPAAMFPMSKKLSGRRLDGITHDGYPVVPQ